MNEENSKSEIERKGRYKESDSVARITKRRRKMNKKGTVLCRGKQKENKIKESDWLPGKLSLIKKLQTTKSRVRCEPPTR
jgi:hypothetical protein